MCDLASWVETPEKIYFMDNVAIAKYRRDNPDRTIYDVTGHHAIREYYEISDEGRDRECTDFSTPDNFPLEIVSAIKAGRMSKHNVFPEGLVRESLFDAIPEIKEAQTAYKKATAAYRIASVICGKVQFAYRIASVICGKVQSAYDEVSAAYEEASAAYGKMQSAYNEVSVVRDEALTAYKEARSVHGWKLFRSVENRCPAWK